MIYEKIGILKERNPKCLCANAVGCSEMEILDICGNFSPLKIYQSISIKLFQTIEKDKIRGKRYIDMFQKRYVRFKVLKNGRSTSTCKSHPC